MYKLSAILLFLVKKFAIVLLVFRFGFCRAASEKAIKISNKKRLNLFWKICCRNNFRLFAVAFFGNAYHFRTIHSQAYTRV